MLIAEDAGRPDLWGPKGPVSGTTDVSGAAWADELGTYALHGWQPNNPAGAGEGGPCGVNCSNDNEIFGFHTGGANVVFGDGSVHFLSNNIDIGILAALTTKSGGEVLNSSDY